MDYFAHKENDRTQTIKEHLTGTAELASGFAVGMMKNMAYETARIHDIGKYAEAFQDRIMNNSTEKYEHSSCGAIELGRLADNSKRKSILPMMQYCVAGHHTGLPDGGTSKDSPMEPTLNGRLKREKNYTGRSDYSCYKNEICLDFPDTGELFSELRSSADMTDMIEKYAFFTRYLFSCLTDSDFLDTERFCSPGTDRSIHGDFDAVSAAVDEKIAGFKHETALQSARKRLQKQAYSNSRTNSNISILNMPTGSGKTLCSLKIALDKLKTSGKKRIIYVIPYTSIIEQTAECFEDIFGSNMDILQHHSNYCFNDDDENYDTAEKLKRSAENWDAPFIITTSVQFFQSLYHYKGSGLRKLHNLADSVIIFDEVHMLPEKYLQPCIRGIGYITKYLNSEAIFLSATMPDYSKLFSSFIPDCPVTELIRSKDDFAYFQKCSYEYLGQTDYDSIIEKSTAYKSNLIIVNKRKTAKEIYRKLSGNKYHLSTYMTPKDRLETIEKIRKDLLKEIPVTVVSTSLIEAGVDVDFETVFRELSGLDSILQSGGRCNREGKRDHGNVFIFETEEKPQREIAARTSIVHDLLRNGADISSDGAIQEYYRRLFDFKDSEIQKNSIANGVAGFDMIPFRQYANDFQFIKDDTVSLVINNCKETEELLSQLENGMLSAKRKLQRYSVSLKKESELDKAKSFITEVNGIFVLSDKAHYNSETGLDIEMFNDMIV